MAYKDPEKRRAAKARSRAKHKAQIADYNRRYWLANAQRLGDKNRRKATAWVHATPERLAARKQSFHEWGQKNPEKRRAAEQRRREQKRAEIVAHRHAFYEAHKEQEFAYARNRRARVQGAAGRFTASDWRAVRDHYGNRCVACGVDGRLTVDHVVPLSLGGDHSVANVQPLCLPCNLKKHTRAIDYRPCPPHTECSFTTEVQLFGRNINR